MTTLHQAIPTPSTTVTITRAGSLEGVLRWSTLGILFCALSSLLGGIWDIQWHEDVGPDTFTTAPHLMLYAGAAGAGLISLAVTLLCTRLVSTGRVMPHLPLVSLLRGAFWGPAGFVVTGTGAGLYLLFGLYDLWWHTIYGFDAVLGSPPHTGLGLADITMLSGTVVIGATLIGLARRRVERRWAAGALATALAIFLMNSASWQLDFAGAFGAIVDGQLLFVAALYPVALLVAASVVRRPGIVTLTALLFALLMAGSWVFSAWATPLYAESLGLVTRETAFGFPRIVAVLPTFVLPAALVVDLVLQAVRRLAWPVRRGVMTGAGTGMAALTLLEAAFPSGVFALSSATSILATALAAGAIGALAGWGGWKLGVVLRRLTGTPAPGLETGGTLIALAPRHLAATFAIISLLLAAGSASAHSGGPVMVVHEEMVSASPYRVVAGFSEWPLHAERSLDILFHLTDATGQPEAIADKGGIVTLVSPSGDMEVRRLVRHPRMRDDWGLDIIAFPEEGRWTMRFEIAGVEGAGTGSLDIDLGPRPGPPVLAGWLLPLAVSSGMIGALVLGWWRVQPARMPETWAWE